MVEDYITILEDLLLAERIPVFTRRAKRGMTNHPKLYLFDAGVFRALRPRGPLDSNEEIDGAALEILVLQQLRALNDSLDLGYEISHWRTRGGLEVDFVLYGERGLHAIEVKRSAEPRLRELRGLREFLKDYPEAQATLFYGGRQTRRENEIDLVPLDQGLRELRERIS